MFPLNIGFLSAYTKKLFGDKVGIELYKYPDELMEAVWKKAPDILSLSNYTWNSNLNAEIAGYTKTISPDTLVVFGGPDINLNQEGYLQFFSSHPYADIYVLCEGERGFANVVERYISCGGDLKKIKRYVIDGTVSHDNGRIAAGPLIDRIEDINTIPSPYLTGALDKFFDYNLIPIIETNRGCPFSCIFCAQGMMSRHMVKYFDLSRVFAELEYIAGHTRNTSILCFADANFGIHKRDFDIGKKISNLREATGYPASCTINWVKNKNSIRIAEIMGQSVYLVSSLQSLDPVVLEIIKRQNIDPLHFREIVDHVNEKGGVSGTEIILGLPGETKESHAKYLRELFDWGVSYIICYNCLLINGSELTLPEYRSRYSISTKFRLLDSAYGKYGGILSFEYEEGVRSTSTMTEEEILYFRPVHWLIQFFWNYRAYYPVMKYCYNKGTNPLDFIIRVTEDVDKASPKVQEIFRNFRKEAESEWFETPEKMRDYYTRNFAVLERGDVGKLNAKYIWRVVLECRKDFDDYIRKISSAFVPESEQTVSDLVKYNSDCLIDFSTDFSLLQPTIASFSHDILAWQKNGYVREPEKKNVRYEFSLPRVKRDTLSVLLNQYRHPNKNVTLRKMSEHVKFEYLYYTVTRC
jgi:radical SAM superfamily enzyme YgiQ (UPF0313 family)